jgi:PGF-pre-PGF domain-containing protein
VIVADNPTVGDEDSIGAIRADQLRVETTANDEATLVVNTYEADLTPSDRLGIGETTAEQNATDSTTPATIDSAAESFESTTETVAGGYIEIKTDLSAAEISNATFTFRIRESYLSELGTDPSAVTLYRQTAGEWEAQETAHLGTNESFHEYESRLPGFSVFALGTGADVLSINGSISLTGVGAENNMATVGESITVTATVENRGQTPATETFELTANGEVVATEDVSIAGGSTETVELRFTPDSTGEYTLGVSEQEVPLTVEAASGFPWWIVVSIGAGIVVLLFVIWRRREDDEEGEEPSR